jgi:hypothetical protein
VPPTPVAVIVILFVVDAPLPVTVDKVSLVAYPCNEPVNAVDVTDVNPASDVDVPPNVVDVEPIVIVLFEPNCDPSICAEPETMFVPISDPREVACETNDAVLELLAQDEVATNDAVWAVVTKDAVWAVVTKDAV